MTTLREILQVKGTAVRTIGPDATLADVVAELVQHNIGSLVVCDSTSGRSERPLIGIVTERDVLRAHAAHKAPLDQLQVASVMSKQLITASPDDRVPDAMGLMTEHRVRHLPIVAEGRLHGIISIGDVVKSQYDQMAMENHYLKSYIQGEGAEIATLPESKT